MRKRYLLTIIRETSKGRLVYLLIVLLLYLLLVPIVDRVIRINILFDLFMSVILVAAIYAVSQDKRRAIIASLLGAPMLVFMWLSNYYTGDWIAICASFFAVLFFCYSIIRLLTFIFRESYVTKDVLYAAISVYLMMGVMWAGIYALMSNLDPSSFAIGSLENKDPNFIYTYYSFVTLTTLGYGDIAPMTDIAYSLAILEAIIGQLFLTVLIARLVALHITHSNEQRNSRENIENNKE